VCVCVYIPVAAPLASLLGRKYKLIGIVPCHHQYVESVSLIKYLEII
jgi:hypothetical protein